MQANIREKNMNDGIAKAEQVIAKDIAKIEEKAVEHKISQKEADKEIKEDVKGKLKPQETEGVLGEEDKKIKKIETKKTEAVVNGSGLPVSTKHSIAICNFIRGKNIDYAIAILEDVQKFRRAVPMKGEIPHRKGDIMSGRYPIKTAGEFIRLLKSLKSNAIVNELESEKYVIFCKANLASRPYRRFGRARFKRTNVQLKLILPLKNKNKGVTKK